MRGNGVFQETVLVRGALDAMADLLPPSWQLETLPASVADRAADCVVRLFGPKGAEATFVVEAKRSGSSSIDSLRVALEDLGRRSGRPVMFVSDYIGPSLRESLASAGISYADATGWVRVTSDDPLILLTGIGADRAPRQRQGANVVARLNGVAANRIIRTLCETPTPVGVRELAQIAGASAGSVSKLLVTLTSEGIVERDAAGTVVLVRRRALVRRWVADYSFSRTNPLTVFCLAPRGVTWAMDKVTDRSGAVLTGSAAARQLLPEGAISVVPLRQIVVYAEDPLPLRKQWGLVDADPPTANVLIARPQDLDILRVAPSAAGFALAPVALVLADLLTLPGRSDAEAEQLMDLLAQHDAAWKE